MDTILITIVENTKHETSEHQARTTRKIVFFFFFFYAIFITIVENPEQDTYCP